MAFSPDESSTSRRAIILAGAGLALAAIAAYANSCSGPFIFDDLLSIPQNPTIRSLLGSLVPPGGGLTVSGRPVLNLSFALNHALSGDHVWSYHALNLLIHVGAGLALFGIVRRTVLRIGRDHDIPPFARPAPARSGRIPDPGNAGSKIPVRAPKDATIVAFFAALLWTLHPLQTESVTYIVQRAESLMGLFYFSTLYCFIRGAEATVNPRIKGPEDQASKGPKIRETRKVVAGTAGEESAGARARASLAPSPARPPGRRVWYILSFVACLLGMGTKEVMVSAPAMVFLYDRTFLAGTFRAAWSRRRTIHLALVATWIPLAALVVLGGNRGGTAGFGVGVGFWTYFATQFQALSHYLWLAVWPHPLIVDYGVKWVTSAAGVVPYAAFVILLIAATSVALVRRPALGFLGVWFFAILAPTSLVPGTRQTLAEHRVYLALAPLAVLAALAACAWLGRRGRFLLAMAAAGLGWLTVQRNAVYHSDASIWRDTVIKRPGNAYARNNYGNILSQSGRPREALAQYEAAIRIDPGFADSYYNAGKALQELGRLPEAIARYEHALRVNPRMPDAQTSLGGALEEAGRGAEAIAHYEQALRIDPNYVNARNDLGMALAQAGRLPEAIAQFEKALKTDSDLPNVHDNLGNALRASGRTREAIAQFEEALRLKPDFAAAHNNLGNAFREANRLPEAIAQYEQALKIDPGVPQVHNNLGVALLMAGRAADAITQFEQALRLNPNLAQVHLNLAIALASAGRKREAEAQYEAARRLGARLPGQE